MMLLRDLLAPWFHYSGAEAVAEPCLDSRKVVEGGLFVAVPDIRPMVGSMLPPPSTREPRLPCCIRTIRMPTARWSGSKA